jgi:hypothetical protein
MAITPISRASTPRQLVPGLNAVLGMAYGSIDNEHSVLFTTENSNKYFEEDVFQTGFGLAPQKGEGETMFYDTATEAWTARYEHQTIALGFAITEEQEEDNLYENLGKKMAYYVGRSMAQTKQQTAANIFNNGFNTSFLGGDGQPLFSASHPTVGDGNQSNTFSVDLSETALENAVISIKLQKDDRGIFTNAQPVSLHIPPQLRYIAKRILESEGRVGTADNDLNALKEYGDLGMFYINHRFTDPDAWFIKTDIGDSTKHYVRVALQTKTDGDFDTGNMKYKARERYSFGWSDWRGFVGSAGA